MKDIGYKIKNKDLEFIDGKISRCTKDNGSKI